MKNTIVFAIKNGEAMSLYSDLDYETRSILDIDDNEKYFDDMIVFSDVKYCFDPDNPIKSNEELDDLDSGIYIFGGRVIAIGVTYRYNDTFEAHEFHLQGELVSVDFGNENHLKLMENI